MGTAETHPLLTLCTNKRSRAMGFGGLPSPGADLEPEQLHNSKVVEKETALQPDEK